MLFDEHGDQQPKLGGLEKLPTGEKEGKVSVITSMEGKLRCALSAECAWGADALSVSSGLREVWPEVFVHRAKLS